MTDVFAIQDEIAQAISDALKLRLAPRTQTVNLEAYQNYLKGQYYLALFTPESLAKAKECLERVVAIDPNYAPAYTSLGHYYYMIAIVGIAPNREIVPLAKSAAEKALALDPANSDAHGVLGVMAAVFDYDWKLAETHFRKSMSLEPVPSMARFRYSQFYLLILGRFEEALEQSQLALETDPLSMPAHFGVASSMFGAKRYRESIEYTRRVLEIDPSYYVLWLMLGLAQLAAGSTQNATISLRRVMDLAPWYSFGMGFLAVAYYQAGEHERSHEWVQKLAQVHRDTVGAANYYAAVGEPDAMFEALEAAFQQRSRELVNIKQMWLMDQYRLDPRYQALLAKMNLI